MSLQRHLEVLEKTRDSKNGVCKTGFPENFKQLISVNVTHLVICCLMFFLNFYNYLILSFFPQSPATFHALLILGNLFYFL